MRNYLYLNAIDLFKGLTALNKYSINLYILKNAKLVVYNSVQGPQKSWA